MIPTNKLFCFILFVLIVAPKNAHCEIRGLIVQTPEGLVKQNANGIYRLGSTSKTFHSYYMLKSSYLPTSTFPTKLFATALNDPESGNFEGNLIVDNSKGNYGFYLETTARYTNGINHAYQSLFKQMELVQRDPTSGIRKLAREFQNQYRLNSWTGKLVFEHPFSDINSGSTMPSLVINDNLVDIIVHPNLDIKVVPEKIFTVISDNLKHCNTPTCTNVSFSVNFAQWKINVSGTVFSGITRQVSHTQDIFTRDTVAQNFPEKMFERIFVDELVKLGVEVKTADVSGIQRNFITELPSMPISEYLKEYLFQSLGRIGEYYACVPTKNYPRAIAELNTFYQKLYPETWINFGNAIGDDNKANISVIYDFFDKIQTDVNFPTIFNALPILGESGTLSQKNFKAVQSLIGLVHAKSGDNFVMENGKFTGNFCLGGYTATASGFTPFVALVNDFSLPDYDGSNIDEVMEVVKEKQYIVTVELAKVYKLPTDDSHFGIIGKQIVPENSIVFGQVVTIATVIALFVVILVGVVGAVIHRRMTQSPELVLITTDKTKYNSIDFEL